MSPDLSDRVGEEAIALLAERRARGAALERAVDAVRGSNLVPSLQAVATKLPLAVDVETAAIRLRDQDTNRFHLLAAAGIPSRDLRRLAIDEVDLAQLKTLYTLRGHHSHARGLGLRWLEGVWLEHGNAVIGSITVGSRTERRPGETELTLLRAIADRLSLRLEGLDRSREVLRREATAVARELVTSHEPAARKFAHELRPRERTILELYADGMATGEIAEFLVISPHTVRTHVKLALRRLGVHSRQEAEQLVRKDLAARLL
jgi:DNA-binding CsgD family transcriptional regulator